MRGIPELGGDAGDVVVVHEGQQVGPLVEGPGLRPVLAGQAVADLKQVAVVEAGPQPLVAVVVGYRVAQLRPHPEVVIPAQDLAHQGEVGFQRLGKGPQALQIVGGEAVGHVQPQPVDPELLHPVPDGLELVLHHVRVVEVQLDQLAVSLPVFVPEAVAPVGVAVEVQIEPVPIGAAPLLLLNVPKGPEAPAHMVEHPVQQDPEPGVVSGAAHLSQVLVGPQAGVQPVVVPGVIAVAVTVKHRIEQDGVRPQPFDVLHPVQQPQDAALGTPVVVRRRAAQAQGVDLIEDRLVKPHIGHSFRLTAGGPSGREAH